MMYHYVIAITYVIVSFYCQFDTNIKSSGKREPQMKNFPNETGSWSCVWGIFFIADWCGMVVVGCFEPWLKWEFKAKEEENWETPKSNSFKVVYKGDVVVENISIIRKKQ